jgi:F-type H+-transporting ATPase subunit epsilon
MTVMADHASTISSLRPGVLTATGPEGARQYLVTGGFAEISPNGTSVLAERAILREDVTQADIDDMVADATAARDAASADAADAAAKTLADIIAMGGELGLTTS